MALSMSSRRQLGSWARLNAVESVCIILSIVHSDLLWVKSAFWLSKTGEKRIVPVRFARQAHSVRFEIELPKEDLRMSNELVILVIFLQSLFLVVERESIQTKRPPKHIHTLTHTFDLTRSRYFRSLLAKRNSYFTKYIYTKKLLLLAYFKSVANVRDARHEDRAKSTKKSIAPLVFLFLFSQSCRCFGHAFALLYLEFHKSGYTNLQVNFGWLIQQKKVAFWTNGAGSFE